MVHKNDIIELSRGGLSLALAPDCGGSIRHFRLHQAGKTIELMRPAPVGGGVLDMACFPLVPFSNRIEQGTFRYEGREITLAPSPPLPDSYPLHGQGWQNPWRVAALHESDATLVYAHPADDKDGWPWHYEATQAFSLSDSGLTVTLSVINRDDKKMPFGLGLHPYFPADETTRVHAGLEGVWLTDAHCIPVQHAPLPPEWDFNRGLCPLDLEVDNCFSGWNGRAVIHRPGVELIMSHSGPLRSLVIYRPADGNFFCLEPVSNVTNAFNMPADSESGVIELEPGRECKVTIGFDVKTTPG
jgi:aldose 1-epimerase